MDEVKAALTVLKEGRGELEVDYSLRALINLAVESKKNDELKYN